VLVLVVLDELLLVLVDDVVEVEDTVVDDVVVDVDVDVLVVVDDVVVDTDVVAVDVRLVVCVVDGDVISHPKKVPLPWRATISFSASARSERRDSPVPSVSSSNGTSRMTCTSPL